MKSFKSSYKNVIKSNFKGMYANLISDEMRLHDFNDISIVC